MDFLFKPNGKVVAAFTDETQQTLQAVGHPEVARASNVEWERIGNDEGWTVRAAYDPELAIRAVLHSGGYRKVVSRTGDILCFVTRAAALEAEQQFFWELLPPEKR